MSGHSDPWGAIPIPDFPTIINDFESFNEYLLNNQLPPRLSVWHVAFLASKRSNEVGARYKTLHDLINARKLVPEMGVPVYGDRAILPLIMRTDTAAPKPLPWITAKSLSTLFRGEGWSISTFPERFRLWLDLDFASIEPCGGKVRLKENTTDSQAGNSKRRRDPLSKDLELAWGNCQERLRRDPTYLEVFMELEKVGAPTYTAVLGVSDDGEVILYEDNKGKEHKLNLNALAARVERGKGGGDLKPYQTNDKHDSHGKGVSVA